MEENVTTDLDPSEEPKTPKEGGISPSGITPLPTGGRITPQGVIGNDAAHAQYILGSTGTMIGGTISALNSLSDSMEQLDYSVFVRLQPSLDNRITQTLDPIKEKLDSTQKQVQEAKTSLNNLMDFIEINRNSLTGLITTQGKMNGIESQMSSVLKRLEKLESDKNISWSKYATIFAIIISLFSILCASIVGFAEIYTAFFKR